jgi:hypothetical protein
MDAVYRARVVLKVDRKRTASVVKKANAVNTGMAKDTTRFAVPVPPLAVLAAQITTLATAEQLAVARVRGAAATRSVARETLLRMLETERSYVQALCDGTPAEAAAIAESAGMAIAAHPTRHKPVLEVTPGAQPGTADLDANVAALAGRDAKRRCFNWQWTADGGKTFNSAPSTPHGKTTITGLPSLTMIGFRASATGVKGAGEWSQIVTVLIH